MGALRFKIRGSQGDIYSVAFEKIASGFMMTCTCEAAGHGLHCHHRIELLRGELGALVSKNKDEAAMLAQLIAGSKLEEALLAFGRAEEAQRLAKLDRDRWAKAVGRLMLG